MLLSDETCVMRQPIPQAELVARPRNFFKLSDSSLREAFQGTREVTEAVDEDTLGMALPGNHVRRLLERSIGSRSRYQHLFKVDHTKPSMQVAVRDQAGHAIVHGLSESVQVWPDVSVVTVRRMGAHLLQPGLAHLLQLNPQPLAQVTQQTGGPFQATEPCPGGIVRALPLSLLQQCLHLDSTCPKLLYEEVGTLGINMRAVLTEVCDQALEATASIRGHFGEVSGGHGPATEESAKAPIACDYGQRESCQGNGRKGDEHQAERYTRPIPLEAVVPENRIEGVT
mmetsp:Transcript_75936/g.183587  ORF Transcript_75936/g.183587 Transcript_75936/m.183587 type:complete len:284 (+) Transcript_75936:1671-2522(+)